MKRFSKGLVVGKFCPLHLGHEYLISTALDQCEQLWIVSYTRPEFPGLGPTMRQVWLTERFPSAQVVAFDQRRLDQLCRDLGVVSREIPQNDADDEAHRSFMAWLCQAVLGTMVDAVFTSESYGAGFAASLSVHFTRQHNKPVLVEHISVDAERRRWPISGTQLRKSRYSQRDLVSPDVWSDLQPRIAILGGESSGKTTLAQALANQLGCNWVSEYGRTLWEQREGMLHFDDMLAIATEQVRQERMLAQAGAFLICDTTPLVTEFYSQDMFGKVDPELKVLSLRQYQMVFLCDADFDFVQDGTRRDRVFRERQQGWYSEQLAHRDIDFVVLSGSLNVRLMKAIDLIECSEAELT
jgi:HTH-type transcriptional regulator, transcriptional repressor of NAD biosynthesis genes